MTDAAECHEIECESYPVQKQSTQLTMKNSKNPKFNHTVQVQGFYVALISLYKKRRW